MVGTPLPVALVGSQPVDRFLSDWVKRSVTPRQLFRQAEVVWAWQQALAPDLWLQALLR